jgi:hypothetical protein
MGAHVQVDASQQMLQGDDSPNLCTASFTVAICKQMQSSLGLKRYTTT